MYTLRQTTHFARAFRRFAKAHPELRDATNDVLGQLASDPFAPRLRLHALSGRLAGKQAVSINFSYRIVLCVEVKDSEIILHDVGSHDDVYG